MANKWQNLITNDLLQLIMTKVFEKIAQIGQTNIKTSCQKINVEVTTFSKEINKVNEKVIKLIEICEILLEIAINKNILKNVLD